MWWPPPSISQARRITLALAADGADHPRLLVPSRHERIAWRRENFAQQHSRSIVSAFDVIAVEDLAVGRMVHNHSLAKSIHDAAWSQFTTLLAYKAGWAGREFVQVNPAYTSQDCSQCGHRQELTLADRMYTCPTCGLILDHDLNAARNILAAAKKQLGLGQQSLAVAA
jgi:putative transposase